MAEFFKHIAAFAIAVAAASMAAAAPAGENRQTPSKQAAAHPSDAIDRSHADRITAALERLAPTPADGKRDEADLIAQQDMARWAMWMMILTGVQAGIGVISIFYLISSVRQSAAALRQSVTANEIAQSNHVSEQRAWLRVVDLSLDDVTFTSHGLQLDFTVTVTNVGNSPARRIWIDIQPSIKGKLYPDRLPSEVRDRALRDPIVGERVIFPGATEEFKETAPILRPSIENVRKFLGDLRSIHFYLIGAVRYETVFTGDAVKTSGFSFETTPDNPDGIVIDLNKQTIAARTFAMKSTISGWDAE